MSVIIVLFTVINLLISNIYYWFYIPIASSIAATFQNHAEVPGLCWIRSVKLLCLSSGTALLATKFAMVINKKLGADGAIVLLGYCTAVLLLLTDFEFIPIYTTRLTDRVRRVFWFGLRAVRLLCLAELFTIVLVWCLRPGGRKYVPIILLAGSAFKYAFLACIHAVIHTLYVYNKELMTKGVQENRRAGIALCLQSSLYTAGLLVICLRTDRSDLSTSIFLLAASSPLSFACLVSILLGTVTRRLSRGRTTELDFQTNSGQRKHEVGPDTSYLFDFRQQMEYIYLCPQCEMKFLTMEFLQTHFSNQHLRSGFDFD